MLFKLLISFFFLAGNFCTPAIAAGFLTSEYRNDGFGAQYFSVMCAAMYAELNNVEFRYSPIRTIEHNYDNDPDFIKKKEWLMNLIGNFKLVPNKQLQERFSLNTMKYVDFFIDNLDKCLNSSMFNKIRYLYRANKKGKENYFDNVNFHIAVHIRTPNQHDGDRVDRYPHDVINRNYFDAISLLRRTYSSSSPLFHIYAQGYEEQLKHVFGAPDVIFHLDESIEDTHISMVYADVLVVFPKSAFSYSAALLSDGIIYHFNEYMQPPLPGWISLERDEWPGL